MIVCRRNKKKVFTETQPQSKLNSDGNSIENMVSFQESNTIVNLNLDDVQVEEGRRRKTHKKRKRKPVVPVDFQKELAEVYDVQI